MQEIHVRLFAHFREALQSDQLLLACSPPVTLRSLRAVMMDRFPELKNLIRLSAWAVNEEYAEDDRVISTSDEIALLPPVSGG